MKENRRRILFPFVGDSVGGSHISATELICALDRRHFTPKVLLHRDGPLGDYLRRRRIAFDIAPATLSSDRLSQSMPLIAIVRKLPAAIDYLRRRHIDLVHTNDNRMHMLWSAAARLAARPCVWHQRTPMTWRRLKLHAKAASPHIVTVSQFARSFLPASLQSKSSMIVDPVRPPEPFPDRARCRAALLEELGTRPPVRVVGYVANLTPQKRPLTFLDIAAAMRKEQPGPTVFAMFGDDRGTYGERVAAEIGRRGLEGICRLMGPRHPIEPWIAACDVLIAPAIDEAFGRTLVEAMLCGTPVVASDRGGHREIVAHGRTGFLAPPDDAAGFARAAGKLTGDPDLTNRICNAAREHARKNYSVEAHAGQMEAVYRSLIKE